MTAIAWIMIIGAILLIRAAFKGQVFNESGEFVLVENIGDVVEAFITGDDKRLDDLANSGGNGLNAPTELETPLPNIPSPGTGAIMQPSTGAAPALLAAAQRRGSAARGYRLGATGPAYYDCSGLVWRALQDSADYKLPRFTTHVMLLPPWSGKWRRVGSPQVGDIVLWRNHHTGIVSGPDRFYSARNPRSGIGTTSISGWKGQGSPVFLRYTG